MALFCGKHNAKRLMVGGKCRKKSHESKGGGATRSEETDTEEQHKRKSLTKNTSKHKDYIHYKRDKYAGHRI